MITDDNEFVWDKRKEKVAAALASGEQSYDDIAASCKVGRASISRWKGHPIFAARVAELKRRIEEATEQFAISSKVRRVKELDEDWRLTKQIRLERAADPRMQDIPGGKTGLLVIEESEVVLVPAGDGIGPPHPVAVPTKVAVDTGLLKERRELSKQAAQELGQWIDKISPTNPDGTDEYRAGTFTADENLAILRGLVARLGLAPPAPAEGEPAQPAG